MTKLERTGYGIVRPPVAIKEPYIGRNDFIGGCLMLVAIILWAALIIASGV